MGLDMYLTAERYLSDTLYPGDAATIAAVTKQFPELHKDHKVKTVVIDVGYWRKANAIHKWFVNNVQDGVDECQKSYVDNDNLQTLLDTVNEVLADRSKASELLPPEAGFFFGDTTLDGYYFEDLKDTRNIIENILDGDRFGSNWDFYYRSSW